MSTKIHVRALEHFNGFNPGEQFGLSAADYEREMKRAKPRIAPVVVAAAVEAEGEGEDAEEGDDTPAADAVDEAGAKPERNREGSARRKRG